MSQPIPHDEPRSYLHHACGQVTIMPDKVIQQYLDNPRSFSRSTFCAYCKKQVPEQDCTWQETGENLRDYFNQLQQEYDDHSRATGSAINFKLNGFRKFLAIALFFLTVVLPVSSLWQEGGLEPAASPRFPSFTRGARQTEPAIRTPWYLWPLAITGGILSLALYCPNWGYKRYALLCGPIAAIGTQMFLVYWLTGRTTVYRFEPVLVAMAGALPGIAIWVMLILRKVDYRRRA
jgi:hypothetical protein